jgi:5-oxoprolinase (ATP-hydrolysing) subunit A
MVNRHSPAKETGQVRTIDLNADMGEGVGDDAALLGIVSSANVACGFHAGSPDIMRATFAAARDTGVAIGAHPGFADREGFGRRLIPSTIAEVEAMVAYQVGAACAIAALAGHRVTYVKAHGALYNQAAIDADVARAIARGVRAADPGLTCLCLSGSVALAASEREGLAAKAEVFADRAYLPDGTLVPRDRDGAVLHDAARIAARMVRMIGTGTIAAVDGSIFTAPMDSICVHGDTPDAVGIAAHLRQALLAAGHRIAAFAPA